MKVSPSSPEAVTAICDEQNVRLAEPLVDALQNPDELKLPPYIHAPSEFLLAIGIAGKLLRYGPQRKLVRQPIEMPLGTDEKVSVRTFVDIVNASAHRAEPPQGAVAFTSSRQYTPVHGCPAAEERFADTFSQLEDHFLPDQIMGHGVQIIVDGQRAVMLRKGGTDSAKTTLALETIYINGIPYPPGSILRTPMIEDEADESSKKRRFVLDDRVEVVNVDRVVNPGFIRLSAFALGPAERLEDFTLTDKLIENTTLKDRVQSTTMEHLGDIAAQAALMTTANGGTIIYS